MKEYESVSSGVAATPTSLKSYQSNSAAHFYFHSDFSTPLFPCFDALFCCIVISEAFGRRTLSQQYLMRFMNKKRKGKFANA